MRAKTALILLTAINLLNYIDRYLISAVMPVMSTELQLTNTQAGLSMSAFMLGYFLTSPLFGYLADRYSRTKIISAGTVVWSLATAVAALARSGTQVVLSRIVVGVGEASTVSTSTSLLTDYYPPQNRNQVMAFFSSAIPIGAAFGFVLGGFLAHRYGWRSAFLFAGAPGIILAFTVLALKEPARGGFDQPAEALDNKNIGEDLRLLWKNGQYMSAVYGYTAFTFTLGGLASWIPQYLVKVRNIPLTKADTVFGAITVVTGVVGSIIGGLFAGRALKKKPRGDLLFISRMTIAAIPVTFACFFVLNEKVFYVMLALSELLLFATQPTINVVILEAVHPKIRSFAIAFSVFIIHLLGDLISPTLVGFVSDYIGLSYGILILPTALFAAVYFYRQTYHKCIRTI